jgi:hypothetical protein
MTATAKKSSTKSNKKGSTKGARNGVAKGAKTGAKTGAKKGTKKGTKTGAAKLAGTAAASPIEVSLPELVLLNNALNQALELGDSDFSTLIGGSKRAGERLLARLGAALGTAKK